MDSLQEALDVLDRFVAAFDQQQKVNEALSRAIDGLDQLDSIRAADILELREGMAALSNRIEGLTRAQGELREDMAGALIDGGTLG